MQRIFSGLLALGIGLSSGILAPLAIAPSLGQTQSPKNERLKQLFDRALQQTERQEHQQAIGTLQAALAIARQIKDRELEAMASLGIGFNLNAIGQPQEALKYYNQALSIFWAAGNQSMEATTLNNMGELYRAIGQFQEALKYYNQALPLARTAGNQNGEAAILNNIGLVYSAIGRPQAALKSLNQALPILKVTGDRSGEATTLNNIGELYRAIGQFQEALKYHNQALPIAQAIGNRSVEAGILNNISLIYGAIGQPQAALKTFNQALSIIREVGNRAGEAAVLNNIGTIYYDSGQPQAALKTFNQALTIRQAVGDRVGEATTLSNMGAAYQRINRPDAAISNFEQSVKLILQIRSGLLRAQRQTFVQAERGSAIALISLLIERKQVERAYQWVNLTATAELADYTRLLNAKVANPEAQAAIDSWNQKNQQLQFFQQQLGENYSDDRARQFRTLEAEVNQEAEALACRFPETAELFETTPADIAQLQASIPAGTTVIHPVLLTDVKNVPNAIAFFILTRDQLQVVKTAIDSAIFDASIRKVSELLTNRFDEEYILGLAVLYDQLIRPIEPQIQATQPKQLSIIATGNLRYLPFEALYDWKTEQYLIQKYPVSYLTRLSSHTLKSKDATTSTAPKRILAVGNPVPKDPLSLPASETEVRDIVKTFSGSEALVRERATLAAFKSQSLRFPYLHLATHGCFQKGGCPKLGLVVCHF